MKSTRKSSRQHHQGHFIFPDNLDYECITCGACCRRDWKIYIDLRSYSNLKDSDTCRKIQQKHNGQELFFLDIKNSECTIRKIDGLCPMMEDNLCVIHREMGFDAKPVPCRYFPHIMAVTPDGTYVGLSFNCPGVTFSSTGYQPGENEIPRLKDILRDSSDCRCGFGDVAIFGDITTDWEGYRVIEQHVIDSLNRGGSISRNLWDIMMKIMNTCHTLKQESRGKISARELSELLDMPFSPPFERDQDYRGYEYFYAMYLVALAESPEAQDRKPNLQALQQGGDFISTTFKGTIQVENLAEFLHQKALKGDDMKQTEYFKHLIWRKELLKISNIVVSLATLSLLKIVLDWYYYNSALTGNIPKPDEADYSIAIREVEEMLKHDTNHVIRNQALEFAGNIYTQLEMFLEPET